MVEWARHYDISLKAYREDNLIVHDQKNITAHTPTWQAPRNIKQQ